MTIEGRLSQANLFSQVDESNPDWYREELEMIQGETKEKPRSAMIYLPSAPFKQCFVLGSWLGFAETNNLRHMH